MLFHAPDTSFARLKSCWKRAGRFAAPDKIEPSHPLAAAWANCEMMLDAEDGGRPYTSTDLKTIEKEAGEACAFSISCLDWFAQKLDGYSKTHMLDGDANIAAMLHEWRARMVFDPTKLKG